MINSWVIRKFAEHKCISVRGALITSRLGASLPSYP
jgi:hypothetical protein